MEHIQIPKRNKNGMVIGDQIVIQGTYKNIVLAKSRIDGIVISTRQRFFSIIVSNNENIIFLERGNLLYTILAQRVIYG